MKEKNFRNNEIIAGSNSKLYRRLILPAVLVLMGILLCTAPVSATEYCGDFLVTTNGSSGEVTGGVWYDYYPGFAYGWPGPITKTFTLPCSPGQVEWAELKVVTYLGNSLDNKPTEVKTVFNGGSTNVTLPNATSDSTYSWGYKSVNWDPDNDQANRVSSDLVSWYNVTGYISSQTVKAYVYNAKPSDGSRPFDGRVKAIVLIVAYNNDTTGKEYYYWVNQGHDVCTYSSSPQHIGNTSFSTSDVPLIGRGNLSALYIASYNGNYTFNGNRLSWSNPGQGSYWGSTFWNVTDYLTQGSDSYLLYSRNGTDEGLYSGYFKIAAALLTVENRKFTYDFSDDNTYGKTGATLFAYKGNVSDLEPSANDVPTTEITSYTNIKSNNDVYETTTIADDYAAHRFEITINQSASDVENFTATWVGRGNTSDEYGSNGEKLYIWNWSSSEYGEVDSSDSSNKVTLSCLKTTGLNNFINGDRKVILLVVQNDFYDSTIETDYVKLDVLRKL